MRYKTTWDLRQFYTSLDDPQIEKDMRAIEQAVDRFAKKYASSQSYLSSATGLKKALTEYEALEKKTSGKPLYYVNYVHELDSKNAKAEAMLNRFSERLTKAGNKLLFFELSLGKLPERKKREYLKSKELAHARYFLERLFLEARHQLNESEEKIMSLKAQPARHMWISGFEKVLNDQEIPFKNKRLPLAEAIGSVPQLPHGDRQKLHYAVHERFRDLSDFAEAELNAVITDKKISDELRGFEKSYSARLLHEHNEEQSVLTLATTVQKHNTLAHRFYKVHKQALGLTSMTPADRAARIKTQQKNYPFEKAVQIVHDAFAAADPRYADIFKHTLKHGRVDVYPKKGKSGGAYCSHAISLPTMVLLNHVDDLRSLKTLAHEMGHAVHNERSKEQSPLYESATLSAAETASTLFEQITFDHIYDTLTEREKRAALHAKLLEEVATIFRQIAFFNFERDLHARIRESGFATRAEMAQLYTKHMKDYMGPAFSFKELDGYFWVYVSHFRMMFYVYSYAYGLLVSKALYRRWREDRSYIQQIDQFLSAGASDTPENIFRAIGVDPSNPAFFRQGLAEIERDIDELERLVKKEK